MTNFMYRNKIFYAIAVFIVLISANCNQHQAEKLLKQYLAQLKSPNDAIRLKAVTALGIYYAHDSAIVEPLIAALRDPDPKVREAAAGVLGYIKDSRAVEPLIAALGDKDYFVRGTAADALARFNDPRVVEPFIAALKDPDSKVREGAATALGNIEDSRAVEPLIVTLSDKASAVRGSAAGALGQINNPRAVEQLLAIFKDKKLDLIAGAHKFFIKRGEVGTEAVLVEALEAYGNSSMAEDYLNCGNSILEAAGKKWASKHGYTIRSDFGGSSVGWGHK